MYARQHERQAMKDALEMAVLTTVGGGAGRGGAGRGGAGQGRSVIRWGTQRRGTAMVHKSSVAMLLPL